MLKIVSCGIIPTRKNGDGEWEFLVLEHIGGSWSFPKGTKEDGETDLETAIRETEEEIGLHSSNYNIIEKYVFEEEYETTQNGPLSDKKVTYFLANVHGDPHLSAQEAEVKQFRWVLYKEAHELFHYPSRQVVLDEANEALRTLNS